MRLREYLPLKQGLRLAIINAARAAKPLREYLPLKQGLRQILPVLSEVPCRRSQRVSSIKTRIKTVLQKSSNVKRFAQRVSSIKTRIKTTSKATCIF